MHATPINWNIKKFKSPILKYPLKIERDFIEYKQADSKSEVDCNFNRNIKYLIILKIECMNVGDGKELWSSGTWDH